jgi:hypothetical protein
MQTFRAAQITLGGTDLVVIEVPEAVLQDVLQWSPIAARAAHEFGRPVILAGTETGRIGGSQPYRDYPEQFGGFDPATADWTLWSKAE